MLRLSHLTAALLLVGTLVSLPCRAADEAESASPASGGVRIETVQVGVSGLFKVGEWTEIVATVQVPEPMKVRLVVDAPDPAGLHVLIPTREVDLPAAGQHVLTGQFKSGRLEARLGVSLEDANGRVLATHDVDVTPDAGDEQPTALEHSAQLILVAGEAAGFTPNDETRLEWIGEGRHVVNLPSVDLLPADFGGYNSTDVVVIAANYQIDAARNDALMTWVKAGGHLVLSVGSDAEAYRQSSLATWVPIKVTGSSTVPDRQLSSLEGLAGTSRPIRYTAPIPIAVVEPITEGDLLSSAYEFPVLLRVPYGFGRVTFVSLDLNKPPLSRWNGIDSLVERMLDDRNIQRVSPQEQKREQLAGTGINDLATQLHAAVEYFPGVRRASVWTVMLFLLLYVMLIGPIDYFVVRRLLNRPHLTWLTFPLLVVLAGAMAAWTAKGQNGDTLQVSEIDVIDVDTSTHFARGQSLVSIYSPETRRYGIDVEPRTLQSQDGSSVSASGLAWNGVPENVFGGMYRPGGLEVAPTTYRLSESSHAIENLPVAIWASRVLAERWIQNVPGLVESNLASPRLGRLEGSLTHHFPGPIENWVLVYGGRAFLHESADGSIVPLAPGTALAADSAGLKSQDLRGFLTRTTKRRVQRRDKTSDVVREIGSYDTLSREPDEIVQMMTFHEVAGGRTYSGLQNLLLEECDLSNLLELDRAVLFGKIAQPASNVAIDGKPVEPNRHAGYVRILVAVTPPAVPSDLERLDRKKETPEPEREPQ